MSHVLSIRRVHSRPHFMHQWPTQEYPRVLFTGSWSTDSFVNSTRSLLSSLRIAASMPRKTVRRSAHRVAPTTVFHQIAQRVRQYRFRSNPSPAAAASVHQPDCGLPPSTLPSFTVHLPDHALAPSTLPSFLTPDATPLTPQRPRPVHLLPSSPVSAESTSQQQNHAHCQIK